MALVVIRNSNFKFNWTGHCIALNGHMPGARTEHCVIMEQEYFQSRHGTWRTIMTMPNLSLGDQNRQPCANHEIFFVLLTWATISWPGKPREVSGNLRWLKHLRRGNDVHCCWRARGLRCSCLITANGDPWGSCPDIKAVFQQATQYL